MANYWDQVNNQAQQNRVSNARKQQPRVTPVSQNVDYPWSNTYGGAKGGQGLQGAMANQPGKLWPESNAWQQVPGRQDAVAASAGVPNLPRPTGGGGGGGGRGGGGGGGGGPDLGAMAGIMQSGLMDLFASGLFDPQSLSVAAQEFDGSGYDKLRNRARTGAAGDHSAANEAYDRLVAQIGGMSNPYNDVQARAGSVTAGSPSASREAVESDAQFANLMAVLAGNADAGQQSRVAESEMARTATGRGIDAALSGLLGGVDMREQTSRREHNQRQEQNRLQAEMFNAQQRQAAQQAQLQAIMPVLELLAQAGKPMTPFAEWGVR